MSNDIEFNSSTMAILADETNWREVTEALVEGEDVTFKAKDLKRKNPLVTIYSSSEESLKRVLTRAALAGE